MCIKFLCYQISVFVFGLVVKFLIFIFQVTPSSKVVGDLANFMVQNKLTADDVLEKAEELSFPKSVIEFLQGAIGEPYQGYPEPLRSKVCVPNVSQCLSLTIVLSFKLLIMEIMYYQVLKDMPRVEGRPGASLAPLDFKKLGDELRERHPTASEYDVMSSALYPQVTEDYLNFREQYGPVDKLETRIFLTGPKIGEDFEVHFLIAFLLHYIFQTIQSKHCLLIFILQATIDQGKTLSFKTLAMADDLTANGEREVFFELNGQMRSVLIQDNEARKVSLEQINK